MTKNYIEFKKKREIGDVLSDTFTFLRENYKQLFMLIFKIAGPAFLLVIGSLAYYLYSMKGMMGAIGQSAFDPTRMGSMGLSGLIFFLALIVFYSFLVGTVFYFIKSYIENVGKPNDDDVKNGIKKRFWSIIGLSFLAGLILVTGLAFCVLPGVYLYVPMSIAFALLIFADKDVTDAISDSFKLVKDEWWNSFLALFVLGLIIGAVSFVFQIPAYIYSFIKIGTSASEGSVTDPFAMYDWIYLLLNILPQIAQTLLQTTSIIGIAFIYFNLNERKNFTGTIEQINSLGKTE